MLRAATAQARTGLLRLPPSWRNSQGMSTTSTDMASLIATLQGEPGFDATRIPGFA